MKLTLKQLIDAAPALSTLGTMKAKDVGVKAVYAVAENMGVIQPKLTAYEKARQSLVEKYSIETKDGGYGIPPKSIFQFSQELEAIQCEEIELNIRVFELTDDAIIKAGIDASVLFLLDWMIEIQGQPE